ncbi:MAG: NAD-dependent DNA ligase LigA, partial [Ruegeria sp.]
MNDIIPVENLTEEQAQAELARLSRLLHRANDLYHTQDAPEISDAEYDALKQRNAQIEAKYPDLKRSDSPSDRVGARPSEGFA